MIAVLPYGSEVIIYGNLTGGDEIMINPGHLIGNDVKVSGFYLGAHARQNGLLKNMINLMQVGRLMKGEMKINISEKYPLSGINEAIESYLANMSAGKVLLIMGQD
jgi:NADPH:quinone reductase-like Zn-dependent oxidoreductase